MISYANCWRRSRSTRDTLLAQICAASGVYQKDLGATTEEDAKAMTLYDPDPTWRAVH
jgi:Protein of unknown function (DUF2950)